MHPLLLSATTLTTCLGRGLAAHRQALIDGRSGLRLCDFESVDLPTWIGVVDGVDAVTLPAELAEYDCRNTNKIKDLASKEAKSFLFCPYGISCCSKSKPSQAYGSRRCWALPGCTAGGPENRGSGWRQPPSRPFPTRGRRWRRDRLRALPATLPKRIGQHSMGPLNLETAVDCL